MEFEKVIKNRRATRLFSDKKIEKKKLDSILNAGRIAPTAKNIQPFKIFVVESEDGLKKIDKSTPCRYKAPTVLMVLGDMEKAFSNGNESTYEMDATIVATHMILEATNLGIDNIWIKYYDEKILMNEFKIDNRYKVVCLLPLGYRSKLCPPSPFHRIRKSLKKLVEYK